MAPVSSRGRPGPLDACEPLKITPKLLTKLKESLSDPSYKEMIESTANVNTRIAIERKIRLPFLDQQTNLAQTHSHLSYSRMERLPPRRDGQLVSYPATAWYKKKRQYLMNDRSFRRLSKALAAKEKGENIEGETAISLVENTGVRGGPNPDEDETSRDAALKNDESNQSWLREQEFMEEAYLLNSDVWEDPESDYDDDRDDSYGPKKDRRKGKTAKAPRATGARKGRRSGRGAADKDKDPSMSGRDDDKPFVCDICGARYKTRPGLSYHYTHTHGSRQDTPSPGARSTSPAPPREDSRQGSEASPLAGLRKFQDNFLSFLKSPADKDKSTEGTPETSDGPAAAERQPLYCDFCLGTESENKKTKQPEEMVTCADCGRSGHPTCLQFTDVMTNNVKKYRWQCIECKTCTLCGTSENDDQMLFCDDCDRGYHMYCLSPPLKEPPEGSWSCHLCQKESTGQAVHTAAASVSSK
ncbi:zinc finger protein DPF3 [Galendromus occidentalis]|uniref:Zinc finger protein DPF3 n=1 Tax=Galendromus occidentalis TaxID=34638 RepID=A0AAJ6QX42_9ACAR|nr:zinc finger protein DPF3 [Galendromus occidentalis]